MVDELENFAVEALPDAAADEIRTSVHEAVEQALAKVAGNADTRQEARAAGDRLGNALVAHAECANVTGAPSAPESDRVLATVLFTDIVSSTERAAALGDAGWRDLLDRHHEIVRRELARYRGRELGTTGDGFLATFDGPARAVRCACAIAQGVRRLGVDARAGLHTGEVEYVGETVSGIAVNTAARVAALAGSGEVLVSSTVKDLVAGSGLRLVERGTHILKGIAEERHLFAVEH